MLFLITLVVTFAAVMALRNPIKRFAVPIYVLAAVLSAALVASPAFLSSLVFSSWMLVFVRRCTLPLAMFVVVMFIGVLPKDSRLSRWLRPIRAELSIAAWILSLGHMLVFLETYLPGLLGLNISHGTVVASIVVALVLFVLLLVLGATFFRFVRDRMSPGLWKKVQRWAYVFYGLVYVHLALMLAPAALTDTAGIFSAASGPASRLAVYTCVFGAYLVLRVYRAVKERSQAAEGQTEEPQAIETQAAEE